MDGFNYAIKKITLYERIDGSSDSPKEASTFERMHDRSLLICSNKITHYFKEWNLKIPVLVELITK